MAFASNYFCLVYIANKLMVLLLTSTGYKRCLNLTHIVLDDNNKMFFCLLAECADDCDTCSAAGKCDTCKSGFIVKSDKSGCLGQCFFVPLLTT